LGNKFEHVDSIKNGIGQLDPAVTLKLKMVEIKARLENTCMQKPLPYTDKTIMFSEHEVFKVELRIAFK
jgi:hypothetical protein